MRTETLLHMYRKLIVSSPLFSVIDDPTFRDSMLRSLRPMLVSPGEVHSRCTASPAPSRPSGIPCSHVTLVPMGIPRGRC